MRVLGLSLEGGGGGGRGRGGVSDRLLMDFVTQA